MPFVKRIAQLLDRFRNISTIVNRKIKIAKLRRILNYVLFAIMGLSVAFFIEFLIRDILDQIFNYIGLDYGKALGVILIFSFEHIILPPIDSFVKDRLYWKLVDYTIKSVQSIKAEIEEIKLKMKGLIL